MPHAQVGLYYTAGIPELEVSAALPDLALTNPGLRYKYEVKKSNKLKDHMETQSKSRIMEVNAGTLIGPIWFIGWMFTFGYANLTGWQVLFSILLWPYYLGLAAA